MLRSASRRSIDRYRTIPTAADWCASVALSGMARQFCVVYHDGGTCRARTRASFSITSVPEELDCLDDELASLVARSSSRCRAMLDGSCTAAWCSTSTETTGCAARARSEAQKGVHPPNTVVSAATAAALRWKFVSRVGIPESSQSDRFLCHVHTGPLSRLGE